MNPSKPALAWLGWLTLPAAAAVVLGAGSHGTSLPGQTGGFGGQQEDQRDLPRRGFLSARTAAHAGLPGRGARWRRWIAAAAGTAAIASLLAACGAAASDGAATITLYSGQHLQTAQDLVAAFEKKTGITVNIRSDDEDALADQIVTEGSRSPADVFFTENTPPLEYLQGKGLLARLSPATLRLAPAKYSSPAGDWAGISARVSVLIYNPALISAQQLPTSARQLADPKYRGKLAIAPQETDFQPIVTAMLRRLRPGRHPQLAQGHQGERRRQPQLPRQRDRRQRG